MNIEMELSQIIIREMSDEQIIVLKECRGERAFPIVIGTMEAISINRRLNKDTHPPRPLTHDLLYNVLVKLDARLEKIIINDLHDHTFFAQLLIRRNDELIKVDARPSDAIALGVVNETPIFVAEHVLDAIC